MTWVITSLLHIISNPLLPVITSLLRHYYVIITSLLHIITNPRLSIITSLLRHDYVIIRPLLRHYYIGQNCVIMGPLLRIITLCISIIMSLLRIITIITYYYVFETGQLADGCTVMKELELNMAGELLRLLSIVGLEAYFA